MSLLVHGDADKLMRGKVIVEPLQGVRRESLPVSISTTDQMSACEGVAHLIGIPGGLAPGSSNVFRRAGDRNDVRHMFVDLKSVSSGLLLIPRILVVERVELDVVDWAGTVDNGFLTIEEYQNLVTLLDIVLIGGDRDDLVPCDVVFSDPCLQVP